MKVEIWSDVVCTWCYIGKRNLEAALAAFEHGDEVDAVWRSFELDPGAPAVRDGDYAGRLASKYRVAVTEARDMIDRMTSAGAKVGLELCFDRARPGNTFDAHRLLHLAAEHSVQDDLKERLLAATFTQGAAIGDRLTLVRLAGEAGLEAGEAEDVLATDRYADEVRADERRAFAMGITAVPFYVVDDTYGVPGAQPPEVLIEVLQRARDDARTRPGARQSDDAFHGVHGLHGVAADSNGCQGDVCD